MEAHCVDFRLWTLMLQASKSHLIDRFTLASPPEAGYGSGEEDDVQCSITVTSRNPLAARHTDMRSMGEMADALARRKRGGTRYMIVVARTKTDESPTLLAT